MNPWLSEQVAEAQRGDWLRAADERRRAASGWSKRPTHIVRPSVEVVRARVGSLLIRAGHRVSGPGDSGATA